MKSKFRFIITITFAFILCFSLSGCKEYTWQFEQSFDNIEKIEIVDVHTVIYYPVKMSNDFDSEYEPSYNILKVIDIANYNEVLTSIENIIFEKYFGPPVEIGAKGIKITYKNGDFDILTYSNSGHYYKKAGYYLSDKLWAKIKDYATFFDLIEKWSA